MIHKKKTTAISNCCNAPAFVYTDEDLGREGTSYYVCTKCEKACDAITPQTQAEVIRRGALDMQVCVPVDWTDTEIRYFADTENPCGTANGWHIRTDKESLADHFYRNPCSERKDFIHVTLDA